MGVVSAGARRWHDDWWLTYRGKGASSYMHKRGPYVAYKDQRGWDVRRDGTGGNGEGLFFARTLAEAAARIDDDPALWMLR